MTILNKAAAEEVISNIPFMDSYLAFANGTWTLGMIPGLLWDTLLIGALGWFIAWWWERQQLKRLVVREAELQNVRVEAGPNQFLEELPAQSSNMLSGSIVLSHDTFRTITVFITKIFGGNIKHYERLLDRARREAMVRLKENALTHGFERIINLKIVTTSIKRKGPRTVEVIVYGTGVGAL